MHIPNFYEEVIVFVLLLLSVVGIYIMLKVHYHFAFGLMQKTSSYEKHKSIIDKAKEYLFFFLKILLWTGLIATTVFSIHHLSEGLSLKNFVLEWWAKIPEGFWLELLLILVRIAVIIALSRYILKHIYAYLDKNQEKAVENRCSRCREETIIKFYKHIHYMVKYTVVIGIVYRITLFFPFLEMISRGIWILLLLYVFVSFMLFVRNGIRILKEKKG